ncbi:prephenate dehydrogenase/arogenate dehydrogenase family protein [Candidatus Daviesbacteria bacterium]|nr:prephenate dehydrogenase/arogenate dehydrogenase family protein [Candidatus Daviesbacteria bacterium]
MSAEQDKSFLVIGGADGMGNWLVRRVFGQVSGINRITLLDVRPVDQIPNARWLSEFGQLPNPIDGIQVDYSVSPDRLIHGWRPIATNSTPPESRLPLSEYDIVMLGVPADQISTAVANIFPQLKRSVWILDICSVKQKPIEIMHQQAPEGASIIGTHPLFGPAVPDLIGQRMVMVETPSTNSDHFNWLTQLYRDRGALIVQAAPDEHDYYMQFVQGLTHFSFFLFGEVLRRAMYRGFNFDRSFDFMTPPYAAVAGFLGRIISANPRVYAQIQADPTMLPIRDLLVESARSLVSSFRDSDETGIILAIEGITGPFQERGVAKGISLSASFVAANQAYFRLLQERKVEERLTVVQVVDPIDTGRERVYHAGRLIDFDGESLVLRERTSFIDGKLIIVYGQESQRGAERLLRKFGMGLPKGKEIRIHHKRARVLSDPETDLWRRLNLLHHVSDIPVITEVPTRLEGLIRNIPLLCPDVVSLATRTVEEARWLQRYGLTNQILHLTVYGDRNMAEVQAQVIQLLSVSGLKLHQEVNS